LNNTWKPLLN
ncbi:DNA polymerase I, partial [Haemophilus influenzae]